MGTGHGAVGEKLQLRFALETGPDGHHLRAQRRLVGGFVGEDVRPGDGATRCRVVYVSGKDVRVEVRNPVPEGEQVHHALQLQVYADAGRREGLDVRGAYVHDLKAARRSPIGVLAADVETAERTVADAAVKLRGRDYAPNPGDRCRRCEVRTICKWAKR